MIERDDPPPARAAKPTLKERLSAHFQEYGRVAVITYFTLSILTIIGFSIAIGMGVEPSDATGVLGVIFAGWVAGKATLPIRILITLAVTPLIAFVVRRLRAKPTPPTDDAAVPEDPAVANDDGVVDRDAP
jgi:preprotein translocase subunit Sss1